MSLMVDPARTAFAVTKSDSTVIQARGLYVGGTGDVVVIMEGDGGATSITFTAVPVGTILPIRVTKVMNATSATFIIGLQ